MNTPDVRRQKVPYLRHLSINIRLSPRAEVRGWRTVVPAALNNVSHIRFDTEVSGGLARFRQSVHGFLDAYLGSNSCFVPFLKR